MALTEQQNTSILDRLIFIYGEEMAPRVAEAIEDLLGRYEGTLPDGAHGWSEADAVLIAYGDSLLGENPPLETLGRFLRDRVGDSISFVHILPFYPSTSDDGFSVVDFREVRDDLGGWEHIRHLSRDYRLIFDGVVNHVSASSSYMKAFASGDPAHEGFFVAMDPRTDTSAVLRTRNLPLLHEYETSSGSQWLWTTFSRDQVDLNYSNPAVLLEILDVLLFYIRQGASTIRLDAIPYLWKALGTSCAHLPQTHEIIKLIRDVFNVAAPHVLLLTETNVPHLENISYLGNQGDEAQMIYNFCLAPLIIWSLFKGDATALSTWAGTLKSIGPHATYLNITATHDGIGMRPVEEILSEGERAELVQLAYDRGGDMTGKRNCDGTVSPYELNISYFDAVNDPRMDEPVELKVRRFMLSQAIPMALSGIPGIYIHSLLGSRSDHDGVRRTGRARSINRQQLAMHELDGELDDPSSLRVRVFEAYRGMLHMRRQQSAFHPDALQEGLDFGPRIFAVRRTNAESGQTLVALHNVTDGEVALNLPGIERDILTGEHFPSGAVSLSPYQVRWLI